MYRQAVQGQSDGSGVVVAMYNISASQGSQAVLQCHSQRMVWTQDRLKDRQRVAHWDLLRSGPDHAMERVIDMFSAGDQRIYNGYNQGRIYMPKTAFKDGNFSLVIKDVAMSDKGIYSCNLHHHYCHLYESIKVQLNVTKSARKERRFWDGQKAVFVVLVGSTVVLPCINRRPIWTEGNSQEDQQQVVHWDRQPPGVRHDRADRLIDLYASGTNMVEVPPHVINVILPEQRSHFLQQLGYILATLLLLALIVLAVIFLTRHRKRQGQDFDPRKVESPPLPMVTYVGHTSSVKKECERSIPEVKSSNQEETKLDYKNNLLKEAEMSKLCSQKAIDLDREMVKPSWK
ncbi:hypothetical protein cypCar_00007714 [Cyprinus carpio]|nr:hypothetical protein cypCar_00007714 [Cyprinus carpio]